jgi:hypothetical protein
MLTHERELFPTERFLPREIALLQVLALSLPAEHSLPAILDKAFKGELA